jgi:hypothetical protein
MRPIGIALLSAVIVSLPAAAQNAPPEPQSARQALIEMFTGKGENDFTKHLPSAALAALVQKGQTPEASLLFRVSGAVRGLSMEGEKVETFDDGPNILVSETSSTHQRLEVAVEHDSLSAEDDEIELSVHLYKNGEPEILPVIPQLVFTLKQEKDIWRVTEVTVSAHVPLEDADYLKGLRKQQDEMNESAAQNRINMIAQAEINYAASHRDAGYFCTFQQLNQNTDGQPNADSASTPATDESNGYRFSLTGCTEKPATKYRLKAVPVDTDAEIKAFCVDESGALKSIPAANSSKCFTQGETLNALKPQSSDASPPD